jgi:hypothetical protein
MLSQSQIAHLSDDGSPLKFCMFLFGIRETLVPGRPGARAYYRAPLHFLCLLCFSRLCRAPLHFLRLLCFPPLRRVDASPCPHPPLAYRNRPLQVCFPRAHGDSLHPCSVSSMRGLLVPVLADSHARFTWKPYARRSSSCSRRP